MSAVRVRQHVNPLSQKYQSPIAEPDWATLYSNPTQPLHLDIGCARGQFLIDMAQAKPNWNFLGVEIREPLVVRANEVRHELGLKNLHYLFCNINVSLAPLLGSQPLGGATIQFPDPWFKKRHQKRRVAQPELIQTLATQIQSGGFLFVQSDVLDVAQQMRQVINDHPAFKPSADSVPWMAHNPFPIATEREEGVLAEGKPVYRAWFSRL
jgi:tRNA (guanine-N7-)-methyltransferase